jgi:hypothetical protein
MVARLKRLAVALLFGVIAIPVALYVNARRHKQSQWQVVGCSLVKDDRVREGHSVRLKLSGPTMIEATVWEDECRIPVGTEFTRDGGFVCNPRMAGPNELGCFRIESETKR